MNSNFWFLYIAFFVFVFPLFFSFSGETPSSPIVATIALGVGTIAWILFIRWTYLKLIAEPRRTQHNINSINRQGEIRQAKILDKVVLKRKKDGQEFIQITIRFRNFSDTIVDQIFEFVDSKPHEGRFEEGKQIDIYLNREKQSPQIVLAGTTAVFSWRNGVLAISFLLVYMIVSFGVHYALFSNGNGWRFLSFYHPWLLTPVLGMLFFGTTGRVLRGGGNRNLEELVLYGKKATAIVQNAVQTGTFVNEQPQIKYTLKFTDHKAETHVVTFKEIVPLTEVHAVGRGSREILYLPDNPQRVAFID